MRTRLSRTSRSISSKTSAILILSSGRLGTERERVDLRHERPQGTVDELMLLDQRLAGEGRRADADLEVITRAGRVRDGDFRTRQRRRELPADLVGSCHASSQGLYRRTSRGKRGGWYSVGRHAVGVAADI